MLSELADGDCGVLQTPLSLSPKEASGENVGMNQAPEIGLNDQTEKKSNEHEFDESKSTSSPIVFSVKRSGLSLKHLVDGGPTASNADSEGATNQTAGDNPDAVDSFLNNRRESSTSSSNSGSRPKSCDYDEPTTKRTGSPVHKVKSERQDRRHVKRISKNNCATDPSHVGRKRGLSPSPHGLSKSSGLLVAYNSSEEDNTAPQSDVSKHHDDHETRIKKKQRRSANKTKDLNSTTAARKTSPSGIVDSPTKLPKPLVKVVKPTAKSTWDSSDSDFDTPTSRTEVAPVVCVNEAVKAKNDQSPCKTKQKQSNRGLTTKSTDQHTEGRKQSEEHYHVKSTNKRSSGKKHKADGSNSLRNRGRARSSRSSSGSVKNQKKDNESSEINLEESNRKQRRSRSRRSSSHSSRHDSEYSSTSSRSGKWRHRRRKRSKSYTSRSSSRESSARSRNYRTRTKSNSRGRHRRHHHRARSLYGRRYRRRSYSSRSRSRSSPSTDYSFRSYRSSGSASSRASTPPTHRSPSRQSSGHRKMISSARIHKVKQPKSPPESRLARLGVGPVGRTLPSTRSNDKFKTTITTDASVAQTVQAAIKRVTSGNTFPVTQSTSVNTFNPLQVGGQVSTPNSVDPSSSDTSGLVDIPLPRDGTPSKTEEKQTNMSSTKETAPYIGPQLPPDLAKRFGLSVDGLGSEEPHSSTNTETTLTSTESGSLSQQTTHEATNVQFNSLDNLIPPEKAEQYRALQEQAKQHALRRNNYLVGGEAISGEATTFNPTVVTSTFDAASAQQLLLLQQQQRQQQQAHLTSMGLIYPTSSTSAIMVNPTMYTTVGGGGAQSVNENWITQQITQMSEEARLKYLGAIFGNTQQLQLLTPQVQQVLLNSVATMHPQLLARTFSGDHLHSVSRNPALDPNTLAMQQQQLQQAQLLQFLSAAASSAQVNNSPQSVQNAMASLLVQQALASQQAQRLSAGSPSNSQLTASLLAQLQQQQQRFQLQRDGRLSGLGFSADGSITSALPVNPLTQTNIPSSLIQQVRGLQPSLNVAPVNSSAQSQAAYVAALLAASQQQQQQQQLLAALRQSNPVANIQLTQDALTSSRLLAPQQQQQLLLALQQKQLLQQQQQQRPISLASNTDQSSLQTQLVALQQLRQQALAATAIAAAQSQRQQPPQQPPNSDRSS